MVRRRTVDLEAHVCVTAGRAHHGPGPVRPAAMIKVNLLPARRRWVTKADRELPSNMVLSFRSITASWLATVQPAG